MSLRRLGRGAQCAPLTPPMLDRARAETSDSRRPTEVVRSPSWACCPRPLRKVGASSRMPGTCRSRAPASCKRAILHGQRWMRRLHLFPDATHPYEANIANALPPVSPVYAPPELDKYKQLVIYEAEVRHPP